MPDVDLSSQMTRVLLQLSLVSNGSIAKMDANSGGGSARYYGSDNTPTLGAHDAPQLHWRDRWEACTSDADRELVLDQARVELDAILKSQADSSIIETAAQLHARIVEMGGGHVDRKEAAVRARTSETVVAKAWRQAGFDEYTGRPTRDLSGLPAPARRARVREYAEKTHASARATARALGLRYSTVLRDLGQKT